MMLRRLYQTFAPLSPLRFLRLKPAQGTVSRLSREAVDGCIVAAQFICLLQALRIYIIDMTNCNGPSMLPTLRDHGDLLLVWRWRWQTLQPGDVVIAKSPTDPKQKICKRIIAKAGDKVWTKTTDGWSDHRLVTVPVGHVWVQGDNLRNSADSRQYGPIPEALIMGRVFLRIWPVTQMKRITPTLEFSGQDELIKAKPALSESHASPFLTTALSEAAEKQHHNSEFEQTRPDGSSNSNAKAKKQG
jgi:signal peptidase I